MKPSARLAHQQFLGIFLIFSHKKTYVYLLAQRRPGVALAVKLVLLKLCLRPIGRLYFPIQQFILKNFKKAIDQKLTQSTFLK